MIRHQVWIAMMFGLLTPALPELRPRTPIVIQVEDQSGAKVPKARIEVNSAEGFFVVACRDADENGKAEFGLPAGNFLFSVESPGFCPQKGSLEVLDRQPRTITTKLKLDACPGPCEPACVSVMDASPQLRVKVTVEDQSGARIPGAAVQVHRKSKRIVEVRADCSGEATVFLNSGKYTIFARAPGFMNYAQAVDFTGDADQSIRAVLRVADIGSGFPINASDILEPQRAVPEGILIAPVPLLTVTVPAHKLRHSLVRHRAAT